MAETDYAAFETKTPADRTTMHVLYGMHVIAPFTMWTLATIALVVNYIKRSGETDAVYASHHSYMIATYWWTLVWLVLTAPLFLLLVVPGWIAWSLIGLWYIYRCVRGWLRFTDNQPPR